MIGRVPGLVRMGNREAMHPSVQAFHMDCLGEKYCAQGVSSLAEVISAPCCSPQT